MSNLVLLFELTIFIMEGCSTHGGNKFRGRKVVKIMEETSLEGERPSKFRKALQNRAMLSIALCRLLRNGI